MTIHHATAKAATKLGVVLEFLPDEDMQNRYKAHWPKFNKVLFAADPQTLVKDMRALQEMQTSPSFSYDICDDDTVTVRVKRYNIEVTGLRAAPAFDTAKKAWVEARAELDIDDEEQDEAEQAEIDAEAEANAEEPIHRTVVPMKYRLRYAEAGHPDNCGDWLAFTLDGICKVGSGKKKRLDLDLFLAVYNANEGPSLSHLKLEKPSDIGRIRMTGGNNLRIIVARNGELRLPETIDGGRTIKADADWVASVRAKHPSARPAEAKSEGA